MAELNRFTRQLQSMLPRWMKMAKDPESVGAQFLNVFGLEFQDVRDYLDSVLNDQYIDSVDLSQIDISYKIPVALPSVLDMQAIDTVVGKNGITSYELKVVSTLKEFYTAPETQDVCIVDRSEAIVYIRPRSELIEANKFRPYEEVEINGASHYEMILHHIWNPLDEFGLLLGVQRLFGERNTEFKARIMDVFVNPGNATQGGLVNALSRELGIQKKHIKINELNNKAFKDSMINDDGTPSVKLISYVDRLNKLLGFTWDNMTWGEAYWKSVQEANVGFDYLPHVWDASMSPWLNEEFQSGIGDGDDLLVRAPEEQSNIRNFNYYVGVRGVVKDGSLIYPEHSFKYKITAKGTIMNQEYRPENYKYTVIASEIIYLYFIVKAYQRYVHTDVLDFTDLSGYKYDTPLAINAGVEVVDGTTILTNKSDQHLEIEVYMKTTDATQSPSLEVLNVHWKDSTGVDRTFTMDTQVDFDRNDPTVETEKMNAVTTPEGNVELGFGDFYHVINTEGDWKKGALMNTEVTPDGSIQLVRPQII